MSKAKESIASVRDLPQFGSIPELVEGSFTPPRRHPSLVLFVTRKAASSYVGQLLHDIAVAHDIVPVDLNGFVNETDPSGPLDRKAGELREYGCSESSDVSPDLKATWDRFFDFPGCLYGPHRNPKFLTKLEHIEQRKVLVMLRDPRDVLTSLYFSNAFSHAAPGNPNRQEEFQSRRDRTRSLPIDEFVLSESKEWVGRYEQFCHFLKLYPNCALLRYESMIGDFPAWLRQVFRYWGLPLAPEILTKFEQRSDFKVDKENIHSHKRQVAAGDHRRKLGSATVAELTEQFEEVLSFLGYRNDGTMGSPKCSSPEKGRVRDWLSRLLRN